MEKVVDKVVEKVVYVDRPYSTVDAVEMKTKYNMLMSQIKTASGTAEASSEESRNALDTLVKEAESLKSQYELIFGAPRHDAISEKFMVYGDAPVSNSKFNTYLHSYSTRATFGAAICLQSFDTPVSIGDYVMPPVQEVLDAFKMFEDTAAVSVGDEVATGDEEDINGHDATQDMVRAVVGDLAAFMKSNAELRQEKSTVNPLFDKEEDRQPENPPEALKGGMGDGEGGLANPN